MIHMAPLASTPDLFLTVYNSLLLKLLKTTFKRRDLCLPSSPHFLPKRMVFKSFSFIVLLKFGCSGLISIIIVVVVV